MCRKARLCNVQQDFQANVQKSGFLRFRPCIGIIREHRPVSVSQFVLPSKAGTTGALHRKLVASNEDPITRLWVRTIRFRN